MEHMAIWYYYSRTSNIDAFLLSVSEIDGLNPETGAYNILASNRPEGFWPVRGLKKKIYNLLKISFPAWMTNFCPSISTYV